MPETNTSESPSFTDQLQDFSDSQRAQIPEGPLRTYYDIQVGSAKGTYAFGKGLVTGVIDLAILVGKIGSGDPETYGKMWDLVKEGARKEYILAFGSWDEKKRLINDELDKGKKLYEGIKKQVVGDWEDAKKKGKQAELISSWSTRGVLEVASFFVGAGEVKAATTAGKVAEAASDLSKAGHLIDEAEVACKTTELAKTTAQAEKAMQAQKAEKAAAELAEAEKAAVGKAAEEGVSKPYKGKLRGKDVELPGVKTQRVNYVKRNAADTLKLRKEFDSTRRSAFLQDLGKDASKVKKLKEAGLNEAEIARIRDGECPKGWQVHHKLPLDDNGTNDFENLVLIKNEPSHKVLTNAQASLTRGMQPGQSRAVDFPVPEGYVYPPTPTTVQSPP